MIRIISTTDLHGKVMSHNYVDGRGTEYGMEKIASLIEQFREVDCLLIDNGDSLEGSPLQKMHFSKSADGSSPVTRVLESLGYDYINVGNHDFDFGMDALRRHIDGSRATCINMNIGASYDIKEIAGKKVAIFGLLTHYTPRWEAPDKIGDAVFKDDYEMAYEMVRKIKEETSPDYIICCYHGGMGTDDNVGGEHQGRLILNGIEDIDVMIAGHDHSIGSGFVNGAAFTVSGCNGTHLSVIDIDTETREITPRLISVRDEKPEKDARIAEMLSDEEDACMKWLDEPLGRSRADLRIVDEFDARLHKSQFATFINMIQAEKTSSDLASTSIFEGATGFGSTITMRDVVSSYSFSNTIVVKEISGKKLREYLEFNMKYWDVSEDGTEICVSEDYLRPVPRHFNYDMVDGIEYTAKISNPPGRRIVRLTRNGADVKDDDIFSIALSNYRASGGGDFDMLVDLPIIKEDMTDMADLISDYIANRGIIDFNAVNNIKIIL